MIFIIIYVYGGNLTVSYSHPSSSWFISTWWEYDRWECVGYDDGDAGDAVGYADGDAGDADGDEGSAQIKHRTIDNWILAKTGSNGDDLGGFCISSLTT